MRSRVLSTRLPTGDAAWLGGAAVLAAFGGELVGQSQLLRLLLAAALVLAVVVVGVRTPKAVLIALPVWLMPLGLTRRVLTGISSGGRMDPLLLVAPLALIVLALAALDHGAAKPRTRLSRLVAVYSVLTLLGALNPLQSSLKAGVTSLIFFVPLLAFWIGRGLVDDKLLKRTLLVVALLGIPAALYGLRQTFSGLPSWDANWVAAQGYTALNVGGTIRPFSTFSSAAEYATFLVVAAVAWLRLGPRRMLRPIALAIIGLLAVATFFEASRSPIVLLLASLAMMAAAARGLRLSTAAVLGALLLFAMPAAVAKLAPSQTGAPAASASTATGSTGTLVQHQLQGLSNPFDSSTSTAGFHVHLVVVGIESAFTHPLGQGLSTVTIAGAKFGGTSANTEADPSNAATALGLPGLLVFLLLLGTGFGSAYRLARRGDALAGVALGILTVTALQWLNGGQYSVAFLPWLLLGWVDRKLASAEPAPAPVRAPAPAPVPRREPLRVLPPPPMPELASAETDPTLPTGEPRRWHVDALERLPGLEDRHRYLLVYLRGHAGIGGWLAEGWDGLVHEEFGPLLEAYDDGT